MWSPNRPDLIPDEARLIIWWATGAAAIVTHRMPIRVTRWTLALMVAPVMERIAALTVAWLTGVTGLFAWSQVVFYLLALGLVSLASAQPDLRRDGSVRHDPHS